MWIFLTLIGLPLVEIALFVLVGGAIGVWATLGLVVLSAVLGMAVVRLHGLQALMRMRRSLEAGEDPVGSMAHGALTVLAGLLLIVPGFFTDAVGLVLLVPAVRRWLIARLGARLSVRMAVRQPAYPRRAPPGETIEGEFERVDEADAGPRGRSGWTRPH